MTAPLLQAENLHKTYKIGEVEIRALQGASFTLEQGEFVAIMGPSGSGKSTLMHLLGFFDSPDQGAIKLLGQDVSHLSEEEYAYLRNRIVGFVFQQFNLMSRSTALENVALPLLYSHDPAIDLQLPGQLLQRVGLGDRIEHRPNELSGGQQQRVAIARALVNKPLIILADEPTGNLDSKAGKEVMDLFKELHSKGMTIVIVTHDENVGAAAERIIRMHDGKIVKDEHKSRSEKSELPKKEIQLKEAVARKKYSFEELKEHFRQAWRMINSNKLRSFLSMLGVLIGVACVITMLALGRGAKESIQDQLARLGSNLLSIRPGSAKVRGVSSDATVTRFNLEDVRAIQEAVPAVKRTVPQVNGQAQVVYLNKNWSTRLTGVTPEYASVKNQEPSSGRFFTDSENQKRERVVLLGQTVANELFGPDNPVGKTIKINRVNFQVIGVLPMQGSDSFRDQDDMIVVPLLTAMYRVLGKIYLDQIDVEIADAGQLEQAQEDIKGLIIRRQRLSPDRYDSFNIRNYATIQEALSNTTKTFTILLGSVAAISLLVGGIGIMNIMLVSVKERTREIGLRKAIGATPHDILTQFLVEAITVTFIGGITGMILATAVSWLISYFAHWRTVISIGSLFMAFFFSAGIGILFGIWPARQAAKLEPIQALRYE